MKNHELRILSFIIMLLLGFSNVSFSSNSYRSDAVNSGSFADIPLLQVSELSWMCALSSTQLSSPISNGDLIFIAGYEQSSSQMHINGAIVSDEFVHATPAVFEDEVLCFGDISGKLYCIDIESRLEIWCFESGSAIVTAPYYSDGIIYVGNRDGHLLAVDMASGVLIWQYNTNNRIESTPYINNDFVYFGCGDGRMYALKKSDGSAVWDYSTGINITSTPVVSGEILYFVSKESLYGLDPQTGSEVLRFTLDRWSMSSPVVTQDSIVIYGDYGHHLLAYNSRTKRGLWRFNSPASGVLGAVVGQGKAFFGNNEGNLYAVDVETGTLLWEQTLPRGIESVPEYRNGIVYVTLPSGYLFAFSASDGSYISGHYLGREILGSPACSSKNVFVGLGMGTTQNLSSSSNFFSDLSRGSSSEITNSTSMALAVTGITAIMCSSQGPGSVMILDVANGYAGNLYAINSETGQKKWWVETSTSSISTPAVIDNRIILGGRNGGLACHDIRTLQPLWENEGNYFVASSITLSSEHVLFGANNGSVYCLDLSSGNSIWEIGTDDIVFSSPTTDGSKVFFGSWSGFVYSVDEMTGEIAWTSDIGVPIISTPSLSTTSLVTVSNTGRIFNLDYNTGNILWSYICGSPVESSPAISNGLVFVGDNSGKLHAVDLTSGSEIWVCHTGTSLTGDPSVVGNCVYVGDKDGYLHAFNTLSGTELFDFDTGATINCSPWFAHGAVIISNENGDLFSIR